MSDDSNEVEDDSPVAENEQYLGTDPIYQNHAYDTDSPVAENEQYLGTDPIYQNHAYDTDAPLSSGTAHETVAKGWEDSQAVKSVDLSVNQNPVSALSEMAPAAKPAIELDEHGNAVFNPPVLAVEAVLPTDDTKTPTKTVTRTSVTAPKAENTPLQGENTVAGENKDRTLNA